VASARVAGERAARVHSYAILTLTPIYSCFLSLSPLLPLLHSLSLSLSEKGILNASCYTCERVMARRRWQRRRQQQRHVAMLQLLLLRRILLPPTWSLYLFLSYIYACMWVCVDRRTLCPRPLLFIYCFHTFTHTCVCVYVYTHTYSHKHTYTDICGYPRNDSLLSFNSCLFSFNSCHTFNSCHALCSVCACVCVCVRERECVSMYVRVCVCACVSGGLCVYLCVN